MTAALSKSDIDSLAESLTTARKKGATLVATPAHGPASDDDAYRIQDAIATRLAAHDQPVLTPP